MGLSITDTFITSDQIGDVAAFDPNAAPDGASVDGTGAWIVSSMPGRLWDRNQAITAMSLAELDASGLAQTDPKAAALAADWREELGLSD